MIEPTPGRLSLFLVLLLTSGCALPPAPRMDDPPAFAARPPGIAPPVERTIEIGRSQEGRPMIMHLFGMGPHPVLVLGGIHGSERNSAACAELCLSYVRDHGSEFPGITIAVIPEANPDGLARGVRFNARRVDLNRNFPAANWSQSFASGRSPGSEQETAALMKIIHDLTPRRILSIHSIVGNPCDNYDGPAAELANAMAARNAYAVKSNIGYPTPGSLGNWAGHDLNIPVVTLELPATVSGVEGWERNQTAIVGFIRVQ